MSPLLFFVGYAALEVEAARAADFFDLCRALDITPKGIKRDEKSGTITCITGVAAAARLAAAEKGSDPSFSCTREGGLPLLLRRFLRRPALAVGTLAAILLLVAAELFVWEIEVEGCETVSVLEVEEALSAVGLKKGSFLPRLDGDAVALALRQADVRIGYAAVNVRGTVVTVSIKEAEPEPPVGMHTPANLVAKCDGTVTLPLVFEGECLVAPGDYVRRGQILASGILDTDNNGIRITRAAGQVLARTEEVFTVTVPLEFEEKQYTGRVFRELSLLFFSLQGKVFKSTGKVPINCDIIESEQKFFAGARTLPVGFLLREAKEYTLQPTRRTAAEALQLASASLDATLAEAAATRTLLSRRVETAVDEGGVTLICTAVFEEDIAATAEFLLTP